MASGLQQIQWFRSGCGGSLGQLAPLMSSTRHQGRNIPTCGKPAVASRAAADDGSYTILWPGVSSGGGRRELHTSMSYTDESARLLRAPQNRPTRVSGIVGYRPCMMARLFCAQANNGLRNVLDSLVQAHARGEGTTWFKVSGRQRSCGKRVPFGPGCYRGQI